MSGGESLGLTMVLPRSRPDILRALEDDFVLRVAFCLLETHGGSIGLPWVGFEECVRELIPGRLEAAEEASKQGYELPQPLELMDMVRILLWGFSLHHEGVIEVVDVPFEGQLLGRVSVRRQKEGVFFFSSSEQVPEKVH